MIGYYSMGLAGFEVEELGDETVAYTYLYPGMDESKKKAHKARVKYTANGRPYFISFQGRRVHLDECLRV